MVTNVNISNTGYRNSHTYRLKDIAGRLPRRNPPRINRCQNGFNWVNFASHYRVFHWAGADLHRLQTIPKVTHSNRIGTDHGEIGPDFLIRGRMSAVRARVDDCRYQWKRGATKTVKGRGVKATHLTQSVAIPHCRTPPPNKSMAAT